jgi:hypothetical protein
LFLFAKQSKQSKPIKQEVNGTVILPPFVFPEKENGRSKEGREEKRKRKINIACGERRKNWRDAKSQRDK